MSDYGLPTPCNCCAPSCPVPIIEGQSQQLAADQCGYPSFDARYRTTYTTEYERADGSGEYESRISTKAFRPNGTCEKTTVDSDGYQLGAACLSFTERTTVGLVTTYQGTRYNGNVINFTETFGGAVKTNANLTDVVDAYLSTWGDDPNAVSDAFFNVTFTQLDGADTAFYQDVNINKSRYRYRIPEGTNTYMRYVVEETFTPVNHNTDDPDVSPIVVVEKTLTWAGGITVDEVFIPATTGDDDTWATEWQLLECSEPGTKTHKLIKYQCYTGGPWIG